jgi:hypothetical protein
MNSLSPSTLPRLLSIPEELPQDAIAICDPAISTKEVFHRKPEEDFSKKNSSLIAKATGQVFARCQPPNQDSQQELPMPQDSLLQSW